MGLHDLHFRNTFKKEAMFRQALKVYLPSDMKSDFKLETLKLRKLSANFIRNMIILNYGEKAVKDKRKFEQLKEEIADLVFTCESKSKGEVIFIQHFEHQSTPDLHYALRNALYDISALKDYVDEVQPKEYPMVLSFLFYHGKPSPYPHPVDIKQMFKEKGVAEQYFLKPILIDYGQISDQELLTHGDIASAELAFKHVNDKKISSETIENIMLSFANCTKISLVHENYSYILNTWETDIETLNNAYLKHMADDKEFIVTALQKFEEKTLEKHTPIILKQGIEQGIEQGEKLGEHKKAVATAEAMLLKGYDAKEVAELNNLSKAEVKAISDDLKSSKH